MRDIQGYPLSHISKQPVLCFFDFCEFKTVDVLVAAWGKSIDHRQKKKKKSKTFATVWIEAYMYRECAGGHIGN